VPSNSIDQVFVKDFDFLPGSEVVSSSELEAALKVDMPRGVLEKLTGIKTRRFWPSDTLPSQVASEVAQKVLERNPKWISRIGLLINFSVSRDYFEPATSVLVHRRLGLSPKCMCFDISNACIGFSNALMVAASMIRSGVIEAALLVAAETVRGLVDSTIDKINRLGNICQQELISYLPVLTLGSGAVAFLVTKEEEEGVKRPLAFAYESESTLSDLCEGNGDYCIADYVFKKLEKIADKSPIMRTEARKLIQQASFVGRRVWKALQNLLGWTSKTIDRIVCHQVGRQVDKAWYDTVGLDKDKEITIYQDFGNMVSCALPAALVIGSTEGLIKPNDKVLTLGFGSGLNAIFTAWKW